MLPTDPVSFNLPSRIDLPDPSVIKVAIEGQMIFTLTPTQLTARQLPSLKLAYTRTPLAGSYQDLYTEPGSSRLFTLDSLTVRPRSGRDVDSFTVQELRPSDGKVVSTSAGTVPGAASGPAADPVARIAGVSGGRIVVDAWVDSSPHTTVAIAIDSAEPSSDATAWSLPDSTLLGVVDGRVIVLAKAGTRRPTVQARYVDGGRLAWSALPGTTAASFVGSTSGRLVLTRRLPGGKAEIDRLAVGSGHVLSAARTSAWHWICTPEPDTSVCSSLSPARVVTWSLRDGKELWALPQPHRSAPLITLVRDGLVYGALANGGSEVLDLSDGAVVASAKPGFSPSALAAFGGVSVFGAAATYIPAKGAPTPQQIASEK